jgi:hypothetical protein
MFRPDQPRDKDGQWSGGLMDSLEHQLRAKGHDPAKAHELAVEIMTNQGTLDPKTGQLTAKGREREAMGRAGRRVDRMAQQTGRDHKEIDYRGGRARVK